MQFFFFFSFTLVQFLFLFFYTVSNSFATFSVGKRQGIVFVATVVSNERSVVTPLFSFFLAPRLSTKFVLFGTWDVDLVLEENTPPIGHIMLLQLSIFPIELLYIFFTYILTIKNNFFCINKACKLWKKKKNP